MFRDNLSVPYSWIKMRPLPFPETPVGNYHYSSRNKPEEGSSPVLSSCPFIHLYIGYPRLSSLPLMSFRLLFSLRVTLVPTSHRTPKYCSAVTASCCADAQ
jgi:hypothetical protein